MRPVATCILLAVLAPVAAYAAIFETTASVPETSGNWDEYVYIEPFNTELGELSAVHFDVEGRFNGQVRHENRTVDPCDYYDHLERFLYVTMDLEAHSDALISFDDSVNLTGSLNPFDGVIDFDGQSGVTHQVYTPITGGIVIRMPYAIDFIGNHLLQVRLVSRSEVGLDLGARGVSEGESTCAAEVTVTYEFIPAAVINEDATWGEVKTLYH